MVNADAQNLDIQFRKCSVLRFIGRNLAGSNRRKRLGEKDQNRGLSPVIAERYLFVKVALQSKIRGGIPDFDFHNPLPKVNKIGLY